MLSPPSRWTVFRKDGRCGPEPKHVNKGKARFYGNILKDEDNSEKIKEKLQQARKQKERNEQIYEKLSCIRHKKKMREDKIDKLKKLFDMAKNEGPPLPDAQDLQALRAIAEKKEKRRQKSFTPRNKNGDEIHPEFVIMEVPSTAAAAKSLQEMANARDGSSNGAIPSNISQIHRVNTQNTSKPSSIGRPVSAQESRLKYDPMRNKGNGRPMSAHERVVGSRMQRPIVDVSRISDMSSMLRKPDEMSVMDCGGSGSGLPSVTDAFPPSDLMTDAASAGGDGRQSEGPSTRRGRGSTPRSGSPKSPKSPVPSKLAERAEIRKTRLANRALAEEALRQAAGGNMIHEAMRQAGKQGGFQAGNFQAGNHSLNVTKQHENYIPESRLTSAVKQRPANVPTLQSYFNSKDELNKENIQKAGIGTYQHDRVDRLRDPISQYVEDQSTVAPSTNRPQWSSRTASSRLTTAQGQRQHVQAGFQGNQQQSSDRSTTPRNVTPKAVQVSLEMHKDLDRFEKEQGQDDDSIDEIPFDDCEGAPVFGNPNGQRFLDANPSAGRDPPPPMVDTLFSESGIMHASEGPQMPIADWKDDDWGDCEASLDDIDNMFSEKAGMELKKLMGGNFNDVVKDKLQTVNQVQNLTNDQNIHNGVVDSLCTDLNNMVQKRIKMRIVAQPTKIIPHTEMRVLSPRQSRMMSRDEFLGRIPGHNEDDVHPIPVRNCHPTGAVKPTPVRPDPPKTHIQYLLEEQAMDEEKENSKQKFYANGIDQRYAGGVMRGIQEQRDMMSAFNGGRKKPEPPPVRSKWLTEETIQELNRSADNLIEKVREKALKKRQIAAVDNDTHGIVPDGWKHQNVVAENRERNQQYLNQLNADYNVKGGGKGGSGNQAKPPVRTVSARTEALARPKKRSPAPVNRVMPHPKPTTPTTYASAPKSPNTYAGRYIQQRSRPNSRPSSIPSTQQNSIPTNQEGSVPSNQERSIPSSVYSSDRSGRMTSKSPAVDTGKSPAVGQGKNLPTAPPHPQSQNPPPTTISGNSQGRVIAIASKEIMKNQDAEMAGGGGVIGGKISAARFIPRPRNDDILVNHVQDLEVREMGRDRIDEQKRLNGVYKTPQGNLMYHQKAGSNPYVRNNGCVVNMERDPHQVDAQGPRVAELNARSPDPYRNPHPMTMDIQTRFEEPVEIKVNNALESRKKNAVLSSKLNYMQMSLNKEDHEDPWYMENKFFAKPPPQTVTKTDAQNFKCVVPVNTKSSLQQQDCNVINNVLEQQQKRPSIMNKLRGGSVTSHQHVQKIERVTDGSTINQPMQRPSYLSQMQQFQDAQSRASIVKQASNDNPALQQQTAEQIERATPDLKKAVFGKTWDDLCGQEDNLQKSLLRLDFQEFQKAQNEGLSLKGFCQGMSEVYGYSDKLEQKKQRVGGILGAPSRGLVGDASGGGVNGSGKASFEPRPR